MLIYEDPEVKVDPIYTKASLDYNAYYSKIQGLGGKSRYDKKAQLEAVSDFNSLKTSKNETFIVEPFTYTDVHTPFDEPKTAYKYFSDYGSLRNLSYENKGVFLEEPELQLAGEFFDWPESEINWMVWDVENETRKGRTPSDSKTILFGYGDAERSYVIEAKSWLDDNGVIQFDDRQAAKDTLAHWSELQLNGQLDMLVGYWHYTDFVKFSDSLQRAGVDVSKGIKIGSAFVKINRRKKELKAYGIALLDLYEMCVMRDQKIVGIPKSLKSISTYFKYPHDSYPFISDTAGHFNDPEFRRYHLKDLEATRNVFKAYIHQIVKACERFGIPLKYFCESTRGFGGRGTCSQALKGTHLFGFKTNIELYSETRMEAAVSGMRQKCRKCGGDLGIIVKRDLVYEPFVCEKCKARVYVSKNKKIEGTANWGVVKECVGADFTSYYPSTLIMLANPGATQIIKTEPLLDASKKDISIWREEDFIYTIIPDRRSMQVYHIKSWLGDSPFRSYVERLFADRKQIKKQMEELEKSGKKKSFEYNILNAEQNTIKANNLNALFGWTINNECYNADISTGLNILGATRWMSRQIVSRLGKNLLQVDTDGFIFKGNMSDVDDLSKWIDETVKSQLGIKNRWKLDSEEIPVGLFIKPKTYVKQTFNKQGEIEYTFKGGVFNPPSKFLRKMVRESAKSLIAETNPSDIWNHIEDTIRKTDDSDLILNLKIKHGASRYDRGFMKRICKLIAAKGQEATPDMQVETVETQYGRELWPPTGRINREYYINRAGSLLTDMGYKRPTGQLSLF